MEVHVVPYECNICFILAKSWANCKIERSFEEGLIPVPSSVKELIARQSHKGMAVDILYNEDRRRY